MISNRINISFFKIPLIYLLAGLLWILVGNELLYKLTSGLSREAQLNYQTWKGIIFIGSTTIILILLLYYQQKKLINSEKYYRYLFVNNPNPMWVFDIETKEIIKVNDAALAKYGYQRSEFLNMNVYDIRPPEEHDLLDIAITEYKGTHRTSGRWRHRKKSGEEFSVSIISNKVRFGNRNCIMVLAIDISEAVENERKLQKAICIEKELNNALEINNTILEKAYQENRRLGDILGKINNMVIILDKNGLVTWVNQSFLFFTGFTFEEIAGKSPSEVLFGPKSDFLVLKELVMAELVNYTKDKREYWVEITVSPLFNENGEVDGMISVENVITERKEKEEKIQNQNRALREIAWISSHCFRRPVASILSLTDMLETDDEQERLEYINLLKRSSVELDEATREISKRINHVENA